MKLLKRITCTLLTAILLNTSFTTPVLAAEDSNVLVLEATVTAYDTMSGSELQPRSTTFIDTSIDMVFDEDGMHIVIHTGMNAVASVVGAKDIKIQKKGILGTWSTVATSTGGEAYNVSMCAVSLTYPDAVKGEQYRVVCTHYGNVDEYRELDHETEWITCVY